jgi:cyclohexyl-isocyanide hydratase
MNSAIHIGFLLFPHVTQLDLTGPAQVLSRVPGAKVHLVWQSIEPVITDVGFEILRQLTDPTTLGFLRRQGAQARYVTSVCNGALVLGAAGLLQGYRSACHWMWRDYLPRFGAIPVAERVVRDRNRISGGGVTAGVDFGLALAAELAGAEVAKRLQLTFEYDPQPPFDCGSPEKAGADRVALVRESQAQRLREAEAQIERAALA